MTWSRYNSDMTTQTTPSQTVRSKFYQPLISALSVAQSNRQCDQYPDLDFLKAGVGRVIEASTTGRAWVQYLQTVLQYAVSVRNFFAALKSKRRLELLQEINQRIKDQVDHPDSHWEDPFADIEELKGFQVYASDGHSHGASCHDDQVYGKKRATTHIFSLNLRSHSLTHAALTEPETGKKKEHEIHALKRIDGERLRYGASKGVKVIHAYDPAVIDYRFWFKLKQCYGVYFITREKSNSSFLEMALPDWDPSDSRNIGVQSVVGVSTSNGVMLRRMVYIDPVTGTEFSFITNEMTLPPGVICMIYKRRWDIEKVFDEHKNKFSQKKAWGKSKTAKEQQAQFIALAHNLLILLERDLENEEGITDEKVKRKRASAMALSELQAVKANRVPNPLVAQASRVTQRSLQFIRWLRWALTMNTPWTDAVENLRPLMQKYLL